MDNLITVAEYAKRTGVSTTAVYKKLSTSLKPFLTVVEGKKYIDITALEKAAQKGKNPAIKAEFESSSKEVPNGLEQRLKELEAENQRLQEELKEAKLTAERFFQLADQAQKLHHADQVRLIEAENHIKMLSERSENIEAAETSAVIESAAETAQKPQKRHWWSWFFE